MIETSEQIKNVDTEDMKRLLMDFPAHWEEARAFTREVNLNLDKSRIRNVCLAGMGGSAIGGSIIEAYSYKTSPVPVRVVRHYQPPAWVGEHTLFIACSFSGNTEETLSALEQARERGAQIVAVTSGGSLVVNALRYDFSYIKIPGGMPPRAALGYSFVPLFRIFQHLGYLDEGNKALDETQELLNEQASVFSNLEESEALTLAKDLIDTLPIVYSDAVLMHPVNLRWRAQFGENSKTLSYGNLLPEMNHNEIVGWDQIAHLTGRLSVLMLIDKEDDERVKKRMNIVKELVEDQAYSIHTLRTRGESRLARVFSLIQLADWTSFYLAVINGIDPTPIAKIDLLKSRLAEQ